MCGIAGFAGLQDEDLLREMTEALRHRGPDESGFYHRDGAGLGSRRLSIIDLSGGSQPILGEKGDAVVLNGEIYNFQSLREELSKKGHRFKTRSDTEVIVHLYEERGLKAFEELSGMFAVALWDAQRRRLVLARDPLGVKPLYYAVAGGKLYFGSEIKALLKVPGLSFDVRLDAVDHYLNYLYIPPPHTAYRGVSKLRPGECLAWQDGKIERRVFWEPRIRPKPWSRPDAVRELDRLLTRVVDDQKVSDVPVGLFLSGGLDSSALAYYACRSGTRPDAFFVRYGEGGELFDERGKARHVAQFLGLKLHELEVQADAPSALEALTAAFDEPMADSSAIPTYWISRLARRRVKVAMTGVGGDEVFGGYPRYLGARWLGLYQHLPAVARAGVKHLAKRIPDRVSSRNIGGWARRFLVSGDSTLGRTYAQWMGHLNAEDQESLYSPEMLRQAAMPAALAAALDLSSGDAASGDALQRILAADLGSYLPEDLLTLADRASMAVGLELRVPLCDQRLVEFALSLPSDFRVRGFQLKSLFKETLKNKLPPEILAQKKQGFMAPLGNWFKRDLNPLLKEGLESLGRRGFLRPSGLRRLLEEHERGERNRTDVLWACLFLEHWFRRYQPDFKSGADDSARKVGARGGEPLSAPLARDMGRLLVACDVLFPDEAGGATRVAWETARRLQERGFKVLVCGLCRKPGAEPRETIDGLQVRRLWRRCFDSGISGPLSWRGTLRELDSIVAEFNPDRVLTHQPLIAWLLQSQAGLRKIPFTHFFHSSWPEEYRIDHPSGPRAAVCRWARGEIEERVVARCGRLAAISEFMRGDALARYRLMPENVTRVPAGVDFDRFCLGDKAEARRRLGLAQGRSPILLTVRNLRARMGLELLIDAAPVLIARHPGLRVLVGGSGPLERTLKERARRLGLEEGVLFLGQIPDADLPLYYQAADLFVLPTRELEGLGLPLLEALACGIPCVGTPVGGIPEVLRPLEPSWIADDVSAPALAAAVERGLDSRVQPQALREHALSRFGWDRMTEALEDILLSNGRRA